MGINKEVITKWNIIMTILSNVTVNNAEDEIKADTLIKYATIKQLLQLLDKDDIWELDNRQKELLQALIDDENINYAIDTDSIELNDMFKSMESDVEQIANVIIMSDNELLKSDVIKDSEIELNMCDIYMDVFSDISILFTKNGMGRTNWKNIVENFLEEFKDCILLKSERKEYANISNISKTNITSNDETEKDSLESLLKELDDLIGLKNVKEEINSLINLVKISKVREKHGLKINTLSNHLVFLGNPGTGKTTVARLVAEIYHHIGILSKGHLVEVDRSGLVGGYVGQTAIKVNEVIKKALGGILFIDEAYSLTYGKEESDFGYEAVDTLLKGMEDNRDDLVVIVAGYTKPMNQFLRSNPGLESRFNKMITFEDYNPDDLFKIFELMCKKNDFTFDGEVRKKMKMYFCDEYEHREDNFANGRMVRNVFERIIQNQANRLAIHNNIDTKSLSTITIDDIYDL